MFDTLWHSVAVQLGLAGVVIAGLLAAAWFFPMFRRWLLGAAGLVFVAASIYAKGARDAKNAERKRTEAAVRKRQAEDAAVDARPDDAGTVDKRLRDGNF